MDKQNPCRNSGSMCPNPDLGLEAPRTWWKDSQAGWLAQFETTGESGWTKYPPMATAPRMKRGGTLGVPHGREQQRLVLKATLDLLQQPAPRENVCLDENTPGNVA